MKVLIDGGSGFLGINLTRYLLERGHQVRILDLVEFDYPDCKDKVEAIQGDIRDKNTVEKCMQDVDMLVHCAAALPLYSKEDIFSTDVDGARNLVDSAYRNKVKRFIHISSSAVYGIPDHHPLFEYDKLDGVGPYGEAKIEAEAVCLEYRKKGMIIPILRPKSFVGPERLGVFALFYDWAKDGHNFPMIGSGNNHYQFMDVEDLCYGIYLCMTSDPKVVNDTFNMGAKEFTTMKEDYQAVLDKAGFKKRIIGFPAWPMITTLRILEIFHLSPLYKWVYETVATDSFLSIDKAEKILNWHPKYSNKQALLRNYEWYLAHLDDFKGKSGITHRVPWKQGILGFAKLVF